MPYPPLYILRHGQTEWNAEHRIQGSLDSALTANGQTQAACQNRILSEMDLAGFTAFSSPQGRAFHTAALALAGLMTEIHTDSRLAEIRVGAWEGLRRDELSKDTLVDESEESALSLYEKAPGGEGFKALRVRCQDFLSDLQGPAVIVTHGMTSRMLRLILLNMNNSQIGELPGGQGVVYYIENGMQKQLNLGVAAASDFI